MPDSENQASSGLRRANWVGLRTLRQLPKVVGETADGDPIYEIRSVRLLLHGVGANFVRLTECSRCGRELAGAPVLTAADLDRPLRPMICSDCIRQAGVSTVWEAEGGEPAPAVSPETAPAPWAEGGEKPVPAPAAAEMLASPAPAPVPAPAAAEPAKPARLDVLEGHLRAVTDRVNELGRVTRAQQADLKERAKHEGATASALAALQAATEDVRLQVHRLAAAHVELERWRAVRPPAEEAGAGGSAEEVAGLAQAVEEQRAELAHVAATLAEIQKGHAQVAPDVAEVQEVIATRLAEADSRWAQVVAGQRHELQTALEGARAAWAGADEQLAAGQAALGERIDALAGQVAQASRRLEALLDRLDVLEAAAYRVDLPAEASPASGQGRPGTLLDSLDRQLEAAARRLAARGEAGAGRSEA